MEAREQINKAKPGTPARLALAVWGMWLWDPVPHAPAPRQPSPLLSPQLWGWSLSHGKNIKTPYKGSSATQLAFNKCSALGSKENCCFAGCIS